MDGTQLTPAKPIEQEGAFPARAPHPDASCFDSILFRTPDDRVESREQPLFFRDLNLDHIVHAITLGYVRHDLAPFFYAPLRDRDAIEFRQEVFRDLEDDRVFQAVTSFARRMGTMRQMSEVVARSRYPFEKERWFLDSARAYCDAVERLFVEMEAMALQSRGLRALRNFLADYTGSGAFGALRRDATTLAARLSAVRYGLLIREGKFTVRPFEDEADYSADVESTFDKFRRGSVKSYLTEPVQAPEMNHIQAQVVVGVSKLFPDVFAALVKFAADHADFVNETIARFDREVHFYIAVLEYIQKHRQAGLRFCYPQLRRTSKEVHSCQSFDLALASKLIDDGKEVVTNDFFLRGEERVFVVSGPNQGGKTTFARTFGQLHYLGALGCPVAGTEAQLFLFDQLFTHFEREEDISNLRGKLHDDLVRIRQILDHATPDSILILNEVFSSTTLRDALFLSEQIMSRVDRLDMLGVWVTFLVELSTFSAKTVSVVSTVDSHDPAIRTFKIVRKPAEGVAYAISVAQKHRVTYEQIKERIRP